MTKQIDYYYPSTEEVDMINVLISELGKIGDFQIRSVELLSDDISTFLFSLQAPESFSTTGDAMTKLHTVAQDVSDQFDRNLVVSTTPFSEGGRKVVYASDAYNRGGNVIQLNPNKTDVRRASAAAHPPIEVRAEECPIYMLETACMAADEYFFKGYVDESKTITEKMAEVAIELLKRGKLSLSDIDVGTICFDIAKLYVDHDRRDDAERFLNRTGHDPSWIKEKLDLYCEHQGSGKSSKKDIITENTKRLLDDLHKLL